MNSSPDFDLRGRQVLTGAPGRLQFARLRWPGRDLMFLVLLSTMMLQVR